MTVTRLRCTRAVGIIPIIMKEITIVISQSDANIILNALSHEIDNVLESEYMSYDCAVWDVRDKILHAMDDNTEQY